MGSNLGWRRERKYVCIGTDKASCTVMVSRPNARCKPCKGKQYRLRHKDQLATYFVGYRQDNKEKIDAYEESRKEEKAAERRDSYWKNREARIAATAIWQRENPEACRAKGARRRARETAKMTAEDRELSVAYRLAIANDPCYYCGAPGEHDDHYHALARGGTDHWWNLVRACARCNHQKNAMHGDDFLRLINTEKYSVR